MIESQARVEAGGSPRASSSSSRIGALALGITLALAASPARANRGLLYGPEDAIVIGGAQGGATDPNGKLQPIAVRGYCVPWSMLSAFHVGMGASLTQTPGYARRGLVDITEGIRCGRSLGGNPLAPGLVVMPRVGYTYETGGSGTHLARVGLGVGYGNASAAILYAPHFVWGHNQYERVRGIRHGMLLSLASDLFTVELSHQILVGDVGAVQDVRAVASVNLLVLAYVCAH